MGRPEADRRRQAAAGPAPEKLGEGVFKIGGNYTSLAVDMGDHVLVIESGQSDARGMAVMAAAKQAIPGKPIRFVVNSHPHFDHASGLAAAVAEGATILTHRNNEQVLERLLAGPRTLPADSLSKVTNRRTNVVEGVGDRDVRKGTNGKVVELHHIPNEHSDGMLAVYLPAEKVLWTADITIVNPNPNQLGVVKSAATALTTLNLDYNAWIPAHPPNPDKPLTKADFRRRRGKPIRFVVNSHPHFDHASGLAAAVAEGATILTHNNNEQVLERLLAGPRTLPADSLSKVTNRRTNVVEGVGDRDVRKGTNGKVVELHRIPNEHSDGMLAVYLPAEKVLWTADITIVNPNPNQLGVVKSAATALNRLNLDYNAYIPAHPPNPEKALTKSDFQEAASKN